VGEKVVGILEEIFGIIVTGVVLAFLSKLWNDVFDIIYEFKRWLRGKANKSKPEAGAAPPATTPATAATGPTGTVRRTRGSRGGRGRRGGRGGGGGGDDRRSEGGG
jgi:hypothetical protein